MKFDNPHLLRLCAHLRDCGGRVFLVGGSVRDQLFGLPPKDFDCEVYRLSGARLRAELEKLGRVNAVGEQFTVYKFHPRHAPELEIDVSLPRRESKTGKGHRGFTIEGDPWMSFAEATRRRDFTINAMMFDPLAGELVDPQGGERDAQARVLRIVHPETFVEDSLRVLRAAQMAARFELSLEPGTVELCRSIALDDLPSERIWGEIEKLLLKAVQPSRGLAALNELGVIDKLFPELAALRGCPQEPDFHPEGDVWVHTLMCVDEAAKLIADLPREKQITVMLAITAHDFGKPATTLVRDGRIRSPGHDEAGVPLAEAFLNRLGVHTLNGYDVRTQVLALVREHLRPGEFFKASPKASDGAFRRLVRKVDPELLYRVAKADSLGRTPPVNTSHMQEWFLARIRELALEQGPPEPLLLGRHVLDLGVRPGKQVGVIVKAVYEQQLEGTVTTLTEAIEAAKQVISRNTV
ncbi:MAG: polynucleotide adenylyltransferase [Blastocatellia bacterium]|nr:polynucleotide adenylyltransferase [Blastocatellia bacterium]